MHNYVICEGSHSHTEKRSAKILPKVQPTKRGHEKQSIRHWTDTPDGQPPVVYEGGGVLVRGNPVHIAVCASVVTYRTKRRFGVILAIGKTQAGDTYDTTAPPDMMTRQIVAVAFWAECFFTRWVGYCVRDVFLALCAFWRD